jgi:hypothetical protein
LQGSIVAALGIGALFHPARHRIQRLVDRYLPSEASDTPGHPEEASPSYGIADIGTLPRHAPYSPKCVEGLFRELPLEVG